MEDKHIFQQAWFGDNVLWKYGLGIMIIALGYILGQVPLMLAEAIQVSKYKDIGSAEIARFEKTLDFSILHISTNFGFFLMLLMFVIAMIFFLLVLKLHRKKVKDIITTKSSIDIRKFLFSFWLWFGLGVIFEIISYLINPSQYIFHFSFINFSILLAMSLLLLPIQTSFEEFVFRGYLIQGLSILTRNKWIPLIITTLLFSLVHSSNPEVEKFGIWTMQFYYIGAGLFLGLLLIFDDGLELSLGVHAATNIYGATMVTYEGSVLQTDALFITKSLDPWMMIGVFYASAAIFMIICYKRYGWNDLVNKLMKPIKPNGSTINVIDHLLEQNMMTQHIENIDNNINWNNIKTRDKDNI